MRQMRDMLLISNGSGILATHNGSRTSSTTSSPIQSYLDSTPSLIYEKAQDRAEHGSSHGTDIERILLEGSAEMRRFFLICTAAAALVFAGGLFAQGLSTINGTVADSSGAVIAGARVTVVEVDTGLTRETVSNAVGLYVLGSLRPARYTMTAEAPGFRKFTESGITLQANDTTTLNVRL